MRLLPLTLAVCLVAPSVLRADLTVVQEIEADGTTTRMTMKLKDSKVRMDGTPMASVIVDTESGDMTNLIHAQKMVMRISGAQLKDMAEAVKGATPAPGTAMAEPKATGKKEKINGYDTEEYTVETPSGTMRFWLAKDYPDWKEIVAELARMSQGAWAKQFAGPARADYDVSKLPGLPLRTEMSQPGGGKIVIRFQTLDRKPIDAAEFAVPAGYSEMKMPAMGIPATAEP